jgi:RNA polymerase sigma-70 factor (ECF subfamily)
VEELAHDGRLAGYPYLAATRAELLRRLGRDAEAADQYRTALAQTSNEAERAYLRAQLNPAR